MGIDRRALSKGLTIGLPEEKNNGTARKKDSAKVPLRQRHPHGADAQFVQRHRGRTDQGTGCWICDFVTYGQSV